jgi:uncharacterized phosphatase
VIAFVRHGRTSWNAERRLQGHTELPLDEVGHGQAAEAARMLASWEWSGVICSPLLRARQTAAVISSALGLAEAVCEPELIERAYGAAEGVTVQDAADLWPDGDYPGAESDAVLRERSRATFERLLAHPGKTVVVGHGAFLRAGIEAITGSAFPRILNGAVVLASGRPPRFQLHSR